MTFLYEDSDTCREHGFALSPDKTCVRCRSEAAELERRTATRRLLAAGGVLVMLLAGTVVWARTRPKPEVSLAPIVSAPVIAEGEAEPEHPLPTAEPPVTSPETHAVLDAWQAEMARVQAERDKELAAEASAQALAEKRRREEALETPSRGSPSSRGPVRGRGQANATSSSTDHPSWWQDQPIPARTRGTVAGQQRQMAAAGVAPYDVTNPSAWLPPNNGGSFSNKSAPSH
jgi:hypothetical protein